MKPRNIENEIPEPWDDHPDYPMQDWRYEVEDGDTLLGYQDWVREKLLSEEEEEQNTK